MPYYGNNGDRVLNNEEISELRSKIFQASGAIEANKEYNQKTGEMEYKPLVIEYAKRRTLLFSRLVNLSNEEKEFLKKYDADGDGILSPEEQVSMKRDMDEVNKILKDNINVHGTPGRDEYNNIGIGKTGEKEQPAEIGKTGEKEKPAEIGSLGFIKKTHHVGKINHVEYDNQGRVIAFSTVDCEVAIGGENQTRYDVVYNDDGTCTVTDRPRGGSSADITCSITYDKDGKCIGCKYYDGSGKEVPPPMILNQINTDNTK